jgi:hypothetical protein
MRRLLLVLGLAAASLGAAGCNEYHYYDIELSYDSTMFSFSDISRVQTCHVYVTGADTKDFYLNGNCTNGSGQAKVGVFEFSTYADSGNLDFTIKVYAGFELADCLAGTGTKSIPATSMITTMDDPNNPADNLVINMKATPNCQ